MLALSLALHAGLLKLVDDRPSSPASSTHAASSLQIHIITDKTTEQTVLNTSQSTNIQKSQHKEERAPARETTKSFPLIPIPIKTYYKVSELDVIPHPLTPIEPEFPKTVPPTIQKGNVRLEIFLDETGLVTEANVLESNPIGHFDEAARKAFIHAQFSPAIKNGENVKCVLTLQVHFEN